MPGVTALSDQRRLAVLVDADNAQSNLIGPLLEEVATFGTASVRRAYGDWTGTQLAGWKRDLNAHAIQPMQQFSYTKGKNSTDSALIIDAMDLLHTGNLDGFVLVSSDSDFTRLATRLREAGKVVIGIGERKTPQPFVAACERFIYSDLLGANSDPVEPAPVETEAPARVPDLERILRPAIENTAGDDGWSTLSAVGSHLSKSNPSFDPRDYGRSRQLGALVEEQPYVEVKRPRAGGGAIRVRLRPAAPAGKATAARRTPTKKAAAKS